MVLRHLFRLLAAPGVPGLVAASPQSLRHARVAVSLILSSPLSLVRTLVIGFRATQVIQDILVSDP